MKRITGQFSILVIIRQLKVLPGTEMYGYEKGVCGYDTITGFVGGSYCFSEIVVTLLQRKHHQYFICSSCIWRSDLLPQVAHTLSIDSSS